jgi:hypothetical protein
MSQKLRVSELDFDNVKQNLIEFLRSKPEFTDYDFTGSGLTVLLNLLAYNTHYNGIIANMLAGESFLDTAVKRETVSLHAHRLGYVPRSARSAYATVDLEIFPTDTPTTLTLRRGSMFNAKLGNDILSFVNRDSHVIYRDSNNRYIFKDVVINEGALINFKYLVDAANPIQKFEIQSDIVDMSTLRVRVQKSLTNSEIFDYTYCQDIVGIQRDSKVFFTKVNENGRYEIYFGDGVIGKKLEDGNVIMLEYVNTNKSVGNYASTFTFVDNVDGYTNSLVTTKIKSFGGAEAESIESIRTAALDSVLANNRAVTETDFEVLIPNMFPVESVSVWGGETNDPPVYGRVFVSMKLPGTTDKIDPEMKLAIKEVIDKKKILAIQTQIVDPEYMFIVLDTKVTFDPRKTNLSAGSIETIVFLKLQEYLNKTLNKFSSVFHYSTLLAEIDAMDECIISNATRLLLKKRIYPIIDTTVRYDISFMNEILPGSIDCSGIRLNGSAEVLYIEDIQGLLNLYTIINGEKIVRYENIGTVNYVTGKLAIPSLSISTIIGASWDVYAAPISLDVRPKRNMILSYSPTDLTISSETATK